MTRSGSRVGLEGAETLGVERSNRAKTSCVADLRRGGCMTGVVTVGVVEMEVVVEEYEEDGGGDERR